MASAQDDEWQQTENGANVALAHGWTWAQTVIRQLERIRDEPQSRVRDVNVFAVALRNTLRAAQFAEDEAAPDVAPKIERAVQRFNDTVPGCTRIRDALEHFDEYTMGKGRRQQGNVPRSQRKPDEAQARAFQVTLERDDATGHPLLRIGPDVLDLVIAEDAAVRLVQSIYDALQGWPEGSGYAIVRPNGPPPWKEPDPPIH